MNDVKLNLDEKGEGAFIINDGNAKIGEMVISVSGKKLTVFHTEVAPEVQGQGLAKKLLNAMVDYARENHLQVIPLCPYVHAQFKRNPEAYSDIWLPQ